jgi:hypothetical protein
MFIYERNITIRKNAVILPGNSFLPAALLSCLPCAVQVQHKVVYCQPSCCSFQRATLDTTRKIYNFMCHKSQTQNNNSQTRLTAREASSAVLKATNPEPLLTPFESRITYDKAFN